ncbi:unnamed protein product [Choristocarpus tenellus]
MHPMGFFYDQGAAYVHGEWGNPIAHIAREAGIQLKQVSPRNPWINASASEIALFWGGVRASDKDMARTEKHWKGLMTQVGKMASKCKDSWAPLSAAVEVILAKDPFSSLTIEDMGRLRFRVLMLGLWNGCDVEELQSQEFCAGIGGEGTYGDFPGPHSLVEGGMSQIVQAIATSDVLMTLRLNSKATCISLRQPRRDGCMHRDSNDRDDNCDYYSNETEGRVNWLDEESLRDQKLNGDLKEMVSVHLSSGEEMTAEAVVVAVPLSVLQTELLEFDPPLPEERRSILSRLSLGAYEKVLIEFEDTFWPDVPFIGCCASEAPSSTTTTAPNRSSSFSTSLSSTGLLLENYHWSKGVPVIVAVFCGTRARQLSALIAAASGATTALGTGEEAVAQMDSESALEAYQRMILPILEEALGGGETIPEPVSVIATSWAAQPLCQGSYSFFPLGAKDSDAPKSGESVGHRLYFAGEATSAEFQGSVHGAFISGIRVAEEIASAFYPDII